MRLLDGTRYKVVTGEGVSQAARGAMLVQAACEGGGLHGFDRLSPTDFALAPGGVMEQALATVPSNADVPVETIARMIVETVDPCVATQVEMADA